MQSFLTMKNKYNKKNYIKKNNFKRNKKSKHISNRTKKKKISKPVNLKNANSDCALNYDDLVEQEDRNTYSEFVNIFSNDLEEEEDNDHGSSYIANGKINEADDIDFNDDCESSSDEEIISSLDDSCHDKESNSDEDEEKSVDDEIKKSNSILYDENNDDDNYLDDDQDIDDDVIDDLYSKEDPFNQHLDKIFDDSLANKLLKTGVNKIDSQNIEDLGDCKLIWREELKKPHLILSNTNLKEIHIKKKILDQIYLTNSKFSNEKNGIFTNLQMKLLNLLCSYKDLCFLNRNIDNGENIRIVYTLHALNHILKTRTKVVNHNAKIKSRIDDIPDEYRDQGFTRPKVLIIVPFRDSAYRIINIISSLLDVEKGLVTNKQRFLNEFYQEDDESKRGHKPEDFEATFTGNIDDHFRIGIGIAKKSVKLYTDFYSSDIILASPLGLRTVIGSEDDKEREYDFLSSIELLIMDQVDVFFMQNWEHVLDLMKHLHLQPSSSHGANFARIRMSYINGWSTLYRQTLLFSQINSPEINSIFNKFCQNYEGRLLITKPLEVGLIGNIIIHLPQVFRKFEVENHMEIFDRRFDFFITKILPDLRSKITNDRTLIFISSYFDFVRLRNYFTREEINYMPLCEYAKEKEISRARQKFFHKRVEFMLYTERFHYFHRYRIRGVDHIVFYELPINAHFYHELCNNMADRLRQASSNLTCTVLFNKYDVHRLKSIVGLVRTNQMITSLKDSFLFLSNS